MAKKTRRSFTKEYKAEVVGLIRHSGKTVGAVCRDLGLTETAVRRWVQQAEVDSGRGRRGAGELFCVLPLHHLPAGKM